MLNMLGRKTPRPLISQDIPRASGTKTAVEI